MLPPSRDYSRQDPLKSREVPKASVTTCLWKHRQGTRLIAVPNGNNTEDIWVTRGHQT